MRIPLCMCSCSTTCAGRHHGCLVDNDRVSVRSSWYPFLCAAGGQRLLQQPRQLRQPGRGVRARQPGRAGQPAAARAAAALWQRGGRAVVRRLEQLHGEPHARPRRWRRRSPGGRRPGTPPSPDHVYPLHHAHILAVCTWKRKVTNKLVQGGSLRCHGGAQYPRGGGNVRDDCAGGNSAARGWSVQEASFLSLVGAGACSSWVRRAGSSSSSWARSRTALQCRFCRARAARHPVAQPGTAARAGTRG